MWTRRLRFHATDSSDPLTSLRFGDRSERRKRQKLLNRTDHFIPFTLGAAISPAKWTLVSCPGPPSPSGSRPTVKMGQAGLFPPPQPPSGSTVELRHYD